MLKEKIEEFHQAMGGSPEAMTEILAIIEQVARTEKAALEAGLTVKETSSSQPAVKTDFLAAWGLKQEPVTIKQAAPSYDFLDKLLFSPGPGTYKQARPAGQQAAPAKDGLDQLLFGR